MQSIRSMIARFSMAIKSLLAALTDSLQREYAAVAVILTYIFRPRADAGEYCFHANSFIQSEPFARQSYCI
jgi:hypothetical protein